MAEIVNSLFGVTPESLTAQRDAQARAEALQYASLADPFARANYQIYQGASGLGREIGGMLGAQDPQLMRAQQRQALLQQEQPSDATGWQNIASKLWQAGDTQGAQEALAKSQSFATSAMATRKTESEITKNLREKESADPLQKILQAGKYTTPSVEKYKQSGNIADLELATKESKTSYGAEADRAAKAAYGKDFSELSQEEAKVIDSLLETRGVTKAKAGKTDVILPGVKGAGDVTGLRKDLQALTKPYQDQADAAGDAIDLASMAIKTNNFAAVSSLSRSLAKAAGETQLSGKDVEAFGIDPSLVGSVSDTVTRLAKGRPTVDTLTKLRQLAEALKKKAESRISIEEQQLQDTARVSGQFSAPQIETVFRRRPAQGSPQTGSTSFNSIQDAEAAKLPKGTIITINGRRAVVE